MPASTPEAGIVLREATPEQADIAAAIIRAAFADQAALLPPSSAVRETGDSLRKKMQTGTFLLAWRGQQAVGCVHYEPRGPVCYFGRLAVLPEERGQGIAATMMAAVEQRALALGCTIMEIGVRVALPAMRASYERRGYRYVESRSHEGFDAPTWVILHKPLEATEGV